MTEASEKEIISRHMSSIAKRADPRKKVFATNPELARLAQRKSVEARKRNKALKDAKDTRYAD